MDIGSHDAYCSKSSDTGRNIPSTVLSWEYYRTIRGAICTGCDTECRGERYRTTRKVDSQERDKALGDRRFARASSIILACYPASPHLRIPSTARCDLPNAQGELYMITSDNRIVEFNCGEFCGTTCLEQADPPSTFVVRGGCGRWALYAGGL